MPIKLLTSGGGGVNLTPSASIASDQTVYVPVSGTSGGTLVCSDSSGNVGIGTTSPATKTEVVAANPANQLGGQLAVSTSTAYATSNVSGITFRANDSSASLSPYASIQMKTTGDNAGALTFVTRNGAAAWDERMRIDSSGNLLVGTASIGNWNAQCWGFQNGFTVTGHVNGTASGSSYAYFDYSGGVIGSITQSGTTAVQFNTSSDYRLKTNVRDADAKSFHKVQFRDFEWIDGRHDCGVIAHELQEVYPDLVLGEKDATEIRDVEVSPEVKDDEGNVVTEVVIEQQEFPVYQQVNYIGLICRMGTVLQQQQSLIESLTERIAALEGGK